MTDKMQPILDVINKLDTGPAINYLLDIINLHLTREQIHKFTNPNNLVHMSVNEFINRYGEVPSVTNEATDGSKNISIFNFNLHTNNVFVARSGSPNLIHIRNIIVKHVTHIDNAHGLVNTYDVIILDDMCIATSQGYPQVTLNDLHIDVKVFN